MNEPLTKSQLCWVIIRVSGVYLIFQAAIGVVLSLAMLLITGMDFRMHFARFSGEAIGTLVFVILLGVVIPLVAGNYLLTSGSTVHGWLMREPPGWKGGKTPPPDEEIDPETLLTWAETAAFDEWLLRNPQYGGRELTDQIALFRDAQRKARERGGEHEG